MEEGTPENHFPKHCSLKEFQKVLVVQALRPDRLHSAMAACVRHLTGPYLNTHDCILTL